MQIKVKLLNGDELELEVDPNDTVDVLKAKIEDARMFPVQQQKLVFAGKVLNNTAETLKQLNIRNNNVLHMILALRGG